MRKEMMTLILALAMAAPSFARVTNTGGSDPANANSGAVLTADDASDDSNTMDDKGGQKGDYVMMKGGKMMMVTNGRETPLRESVTLNDGSVVQPDGTIVRRDGSQTTMKEGEAMDMNGRMMKKSGTSSMRWEERPGAMLTAMSEGERLTMKNGKVVLEKNGKETPLKKAKTLKNGDKIQPDGTILRKDGTKSTLKEGESLDMEGNMIRGNQSSMNMDRRPGARLAAMNDDSTERYRMQNGKVVMEKNGKQTPITGTVTLNDGSKLQPDGSVTRPTGTVERLKEGEGIDKEGRVVPSGTQDKKEGMQ